MQHIAKLLFAQHMELEKNANIFVTKTRDAIKKFCPDELNDFHSLVGKYIQEHDQTEL
jgi:hypothetical protein